MKNDKDTIPRYTPAERSNHWLTAIMFFLAALSGLAFFQPLYYPLTQLFGGGVWTRILHPFFGVAMLLSFWVMYTHFRRYNTMTPQNWEWLRRVRGMVSGDDRNMPETGKFNGGQKLLFWLMVTCLVLLLLTGIVIWRAYFSYLFPVWLIRLASLVHAASGAVLVGGIIFHIYAAIWTSESFSAMISGRVRKPWAKQHHPGWYREVTGGSK